MKIKNIFLPQIEIKFHDKALGSGPTGKLGVLDLSTLATVADAAFEAFPSRLARVAIAWAQAAIAYDCTRQGPWSNGVGDGIILVFSKFHGS